jgi:hypothetical protein
MKILQDDLLLCIDCTMAAVNDDYTGLDYHYNEQEAEIRQREIVAGLERLGPHLCMDSKEDEEFSTRPCACCGSRLHGRRSYFLILGE